MSFPSSGAASAPTYQERLAALLGPYEAAHGPIQLDGQGTAPWDQPPAPPARAWTRRFSDALVCPNPECACTCRYSSQTREVRCGNCGWHAKLTPAENRDLVDALLGITHLPIPAFLTAIATAAPGETDPYPPTQRALYEVAA